MIFQTTSISLVKCQTISTTTSGTCTTTTDRQVICSTTSFQYRTTMETTAINCQLTTIRAQMQASWTNLPAVQPRTPCQKCHVISLPVIKTNSSIATYQPPIRITDNWWVVYFFLTVLGHLGWESQVSPGVHEVSQGSMNQQANSANMELPYCRVC